MHVDDMNDLVLMGLARDEAHAEIDRLRSKIERLRAALEPFAQLSIGIDDNDDTSGEWFRHDSDVLMVADFLRARQALGGGI